MGGEINSNLFQAVSTVEIYSPPNDSWALGPNMLTARDGSCAVVGLDGKIYVFGGWTGHLFIGPVVDSVEAFDPNAGSWSYKASMPTARHHTAAALGPDGKIYVLGGFTDYTTAAATNAAEVYDPSTNTWNTLSPMPTPRGYLAAALGSDGRIYTIGGDRDGISLDRVESYDPSTAVWRTNANMPTPREQLAVAAGPGGKIFAVGGVQWQRGEHPVLATLEVYDPCPAPAPTCGQATCGTVRNGCGQSVNCGSCQPSQVCVSDGSTSASCCTPRTFCPSGGLWRS